MSEFTKSLSFFLRETLSSVLARRLFTETKMISEIPLNLIADNPFNCRKAYSEKEDLKLANSLKSLGLMSPIKVRSTGSNYQLVFGHRRVRAARMLDWQTIRAEVEELSDESMLKYSLLENMERKNLSDLEAGISFWRMNREFGKTYEEIGKMVGYSSAHVCNFVRMTEMFDDHEDLGNDPSLFSDLQHISEHHARILSRIDNSETRRRLLIRPAGPFDVCHSRPPGLFFHSGDDFLPYPLDSVDGHRRDDGRAGASRRVAQAGIAGPCRAGGRLFLCFQGRRQRGVRLEDIHDPWLSTDYHPGDLLVFHNLTLHRACRTAPTRIRLSIDTRAQPARAPCTFQMEKSILELRQYRTDVERIATEEGASEAVFEAVMIEMMKRGPGARTRANQDCHGRGRLLRDVMPARGDRDGGKQSNECRPDASTGSVLWQRRTTADVEKGQQYSLVLCALFTR